VKISDNTHSTFLLLVSIVIVCGFPISVTISDNYAFAAHPSTEENGIVLAAMRTVPSVLHVGDNFTIHATLLRYSPYGVVIWNNACSGPLQATFDRNVAIEKGLPSCPDNVRVAATTEIGSEVQTPFIAGDMFNPYTNHFKATSAGVTNATLYLEHIVIKSKTPNVFNRDNATWMPCAHQTERKLVSPCSFSFAILP
jgi:hypothetical protein